MNRPPKVRYCSKCVYPSASAVPLTFDENGMCSGCRAYEQTKNIDWNKRRQALEKIVTQYKVQDKSNYDCIIPVSGGKDSYFQTHYVIEELKMKPLLVTYHGNNYLPVGERNKDRSMMDLASTLQTNVFRIFNVEGTRVKKIKHLIEPRISHHYSPFVKLDALLPNFDGVDSLTSVHTLSWGLQNRLIFKASDAPKTPDDAKSKIKPKKEEMSQKNFIYFDGLRLDLTQDFDFNELYGGRSDPEPWHDLKAILTSTISTFSMNSEADFNMYGDYVTRVSHGMGYSDPWKNIYKMNYTYSLRDESNTINGGIGFNFIDILKFNFNLNYSFDEDIFLEKIFQMTYLPKSHCWALNVDFEDKIDSGMTFNIGLNLLFGGNFLSLAKIYQEGETQNLRLFSGQGSTAP